ncbi:MAG: hypothetical protein M0R46_08310 [Candidatus Muirbacterium halophilum]|nr:hypothetical protein [Candidatus Muirbacterium halophilum]MCK9475906.1 hypothetical protein [Candidatus Muirbacterium halophilum]
MKAIAKILLIGTLIIQTGITVTAKPTHTHEINTFIECSGGCGNCPNAGNCPTLPAPTAPDTDTDTDLKPSDGDTNCHN